MIHRCFEPLINSLVLLGRWMSFPEWEKMLSSTCNMFLNREWEMSICMDFMHIILERSGFNTVSKSHLKQTISWLWIRDNGSTVNCSKRLSPLDSYGTMIPYYAVTFIAHAKVRTNHRNTNKTYHWNHQGHSCSLKLVLHMTARVSRHGEFTNSGAQAKILRAWRVVTVAKVCDAFFLN